MPKFGRHCNGRVLPILGVPSGALALAGTGRAAGAFPATTSASHSSIVRGSTLHERLSYSLHVHHLPLQLTTTIHRQDRSAKCRSCDSPQTFVTVSGGERLRHSTSRNCSHRHCWIRSLQSNLQPPTWRFRKE